MFVETNSQFLCRSRSRWPSNLSSFTSYASSTSAKSLPDNPFADPHPLNLYATILYKKEHPARMRVPSDLRESRELSSFPKSFKCNTYAPPRKCCKQKTYGPVETQLSSVDATLTQNRGGRAHTVVPLYRYVASTYLLCLPLLQKHRGCVGILPILERGCRVAIRGATRPWDRRASLFARGRNTPRRRRPQKRSVQR